MKFKVLRRHIEHGKQFDCVNCPVALCLHETLKDPDFTIDGDVIHHTKQAKVNIIIPNHLKNWIDGFDRQDLRTFQDWVKFLREDCDREEIDAQTASWIKSDCMTQEIEFEISLRDYVSPLVASIFHPETGLPLIEHYEAKNDAFDAVLIEQWKAGEISETEWETTFDPKSAHYCKWEVIR